MNKPGIKARYVLNWLAFYFMFMGVLSIYYGNECKVREPLKEVIIADFKRVSGRGSFYHFKIGKKMYYCPIDRCIFRNMRNKTGTAEIRMDQNNQISELRIGEVIYLNESMLLVRLHESRVNAVICILIGLGFFAIAWRFFRQT